MTFTKYFTRHQYIGWISWTISMDHGSIQFPGKDILHQGVYDVYSKCLPWRILHTFWPWAFSFVKFDKIGLLSFLTTENGLSNISVRESDIENLKKSIYLSCDDVSNPPWFLGPLELSAGLGGGSGSEEAPTLHGTWLAWLTPSLQPARPSLQQQDYPIWQREAKSSLALLQKLFN